MIYRKINNIDIAVNFNSSDEIFFTEEFLKSNNISCLDMSPQEICQLISGDEFTPMILTWELLDKCTFSCPFCYIVGHSNHSTISFDKTKSFIEDLIKKGLLYCILTGGEVLLHKDFEDIYRFLKESGVLVEIYSNGYLINENHIKLFQELPPFKIEISIYGITQKDFNKATGTKTIDYKTVLKNIVYLNKNGLNVRCKTPFNKLTEKNFDLIKEWCNENEIDYYYSTNISNAYDGKRLDNYTSKFEKIISCETNKIIEIEKKYPNTFNLSENKGVNKCFMCGVKSYGFHINSSFDVQPCSSAHLPECCFNIFELGLDNAFLKNINFINKYIDTPIKGCIGCKASSICRMCPAIAKSIKNKQGDIIYFELPDGHCEFERKKYNSLIANLKE